MESLWDADRALPPKTQECTSASNLFRACNITGQPTWPQNSGEVSHESQRTEYYPIFFRTRLSQRFEN